MIVGYKYLLCIRIRCVTIISAITSPSIYYFTTSLYSIFVGIVVHFLATRLLRYNRKLSQIRCLRNDRMGDFIVLVSRYCSGEVRWPGVAGALDASCDIVQPPTAPRARVTPCPHTNNNTPLSIHNIRRLCLWFESQFWPKTFLFSFYTK